MKYFLNVARIIVGVLFIFSGLVKANDPLGLSYKMQEFFEIWGWGFLDNYTLAFSIAMNAFEIIAGVAILVGWQMRLFSWLLLLLIVFFTFLTGYALFSGKVRECGCFGDCIPLTADQSFMKDIFLLVLIGVIFLYRNKIKSAVPVRASIVVLFFTTIFSFALQWYVLQHLPIVDCLPYKKGNNITEKMKVPAGAIPDSTVISFVYNKEGKELEFTADKFPDDFDDSLYKFVKRYDKVVRKGNATPKIKDFALQTFYQNDTTQALLHEDRYQLYLFLKNDYNKGNWPQVLETILQSATQKNIRGFLVTSIPIEEIFSDKAPAVFSQLLPLRCDPVAIKTAARANPTLFLVKNGTILHKWSYADLEKALPVVLTLPANAAATAAADTTTPATKQ
ncbi:BT_3928 family protein [Paraflavitalea sp. CAU 1676]|uniref:BT_3928 family protein n=1 Tax=Paraflavitalea sp. CAU 1676 TaxID=3032598 RepID=UPI0023DC0407|nr:BT_3928 family protein [Paraflavitalea sp. CAU 1676]MDF2188858.1 DoxX family protein [Paraflavitalea sp. CAU 1676]